MSRPYKDTKLVNYSLPFDVREMIEKELHRRHGVLIPHGARSELLSEIIRKELGNGNSRNEAAVF